MPQLEPGRLIFLTLARRCTGGAADVRELQLAPDLHSWEMDALVINQQRHIAQPMSPSG